MNDIKKKKKSNVERLFSRYKTYSDGPSGSPDQWARQAEKVLKPLAGGNLALLGLSALPKTLDELKSHRRKAMLQAHPDRGGSEEDAAKINHAFDQLARMYHIAPVAEATAVKYDRIIDPPRCTGVNTIETPEYVAETKLDGERFLLYIGFDPYQRHEGSAFLSRHKSSIDKKYSDKTYHVPHITTDFSVDLHHTVLDGEIFLLNFETTASIMGSDADEAVDKQKTLGRAIYYVFDIPFFKGQDIRSLPFRERRKILENVVAEINNPYIQCITQYKNAFQKAFTAITEAGGEGLIIKDLRATYGSEWAKLKKSFEISAIVTGYRMGKDANYIGSFAVSVYDGASLREIGFVSGYSCLESDVDKYIGKVADIFAHELTKAIKLRMPTFHRFRADINPEDCTLEKLKQDFKMIKSNRNKQR